MPMSARVGNGTTVQTLAYSPSRTFVKKPFQFQPGTRTSDNRHGADGARALPQSLFRSIDHQNITYLDLRGNDLHSDSGRHIASILRQSRSVTDMDLSDNHLADAGLHLISIALGTNITLTRLDLHSNEIGSSGASAIAGALLRNACLKYLDLSGNLVGSAGAKDLFFSLRLNASLMDLNLARNSIGDAVSANITELLGHTTTLTILDLAGNDFTQQGATEVSTTVKHPQLFLVGLSNEAAVPDSKEVIEAVVPDSKQPIGAGGNQQEIGPCESAICEDFAGSSDLSRADTTGSSLDESPDESPQHLLRRGMGLSTGENSLDMPSPPKSPPASPPGMPPSRERRMSTGSVSALASAHGRPHQQRRKSVGFAEEVETCLLDAAVSHTASPVDGYVRKLKKKGNSKTLADNAKAQESKDAGVHADNVENIRMKWQLSTETILNPKVDLNWNQDEDYDSYNEGEGMSAVLSFDTLRGKDIPSGIDRQKSARNFMLRQRSLDDLSDWQSEDEPSKSSRFKEVARRVAKGGSFCMDHSTSSAVHSPVVMAHSPVRSVSGNRSPLGGNRSPLRAFGGNFKSGGGSPLRSVGRGRPPLLPSDSFLRMFQVGISQEETSATVI